MADVASILSALATLLIALGSLWHSVRTRSTLTEQHGANAVRIAALERRAFE